MATQDFYQPGDRAVRNNYLQEIEEERVRLLAAFQSVNNLTERLIGQLRAYDDQIQFIGEPFAGPLAGTPVPVAVTDSVGNVQNVSTVPSVTVNIVGGTATGKRLRVGANTSVVDGSIVVSLVDGQGTVEVIGTGAGTVDLTLTDSAATGLDVSDTAQIVLS